MVNDYYKSYKFPQAFLMYKYILLCVKKNWPFLTDTKTADKRKIVLFSF